MSAATQVIARWHRLAGAQSTRRGQSGFALLAGMAVWALVGGVMMVALLGMTLSASTQADMGSARAQRLRAIDSALETAVAVIQMDPSGRIALPTGDGGCAQPLGDGGGLSYEDGTGNSVVVTATCDGSTEKGATREMRLTARVTEPASPRLLLGSAQLEVTPLIGPGNEVTVVGWSLTAPPDGDVDPGPTPTTTTTTTTTSTTTTTTPTTTSSVSNGVTWTSRVTSEWQSGYCVQVDVTNNARNTQKWSLQHSVKGTIYAFWNARYTRNGDTLSVEGEQWNQSLRSGESTNFGWCSNF